MKTYIYTLTDPRDGLIKYVGKTISPKRRKYEYSGKYSLSRQKNKAANWIKKLHSLGIKPIFEIIDEIDEENWQWLEQYWISQFKIWGFNLKNQTVGGEGVCGWNWTYERREKQKSIMSKKLKENPIKSNLGRKGELSFTAKKILMLDKHYNIIEEFDFIGKAAVKYNILCTSISNCLSGRSKTAGGYIWKYKK